VEDIIKQHRRALIKDKSGFFQDTLKRRRENRLSAIASGSASVADASSMVVLTARTAKEIESRLGGKLSNMKVRQQLFDETVIMLMVVINDDGKRIKLIYSNSDIESDMSKEHIRPITYAELFYLSIFELRHKIPLYTTRYPVIQIGSNYPRYKG
jgi:hypothetical protein